MWERGPGEPHNSPALRGAPLSSAWCCCLPVSWPPHMYSWMQCLWASWLQCLLLVLSGCPLGLESSPSSTPTTDLPGFHEAPAKISLVQEAFPAPLPSSASLLIFSSLVPVEFSSCVFACCLLHWTISSLRVNSLLRYSSHSLSHLPPPCLCPFWPVCLEALLTHIIASNVHFCIHTHIKYKALVGRHCAWLLCIFPCALSGALHIVGA